MRKLLSDPSARNRAPFMAAPEAERLVLTGYRCWLAGYETGDIACWELAWNEFLRSVGARHAKSTLGELSAWVRSLRASACRSLQVYPHACRYVTGDELKVVGLLGACQSGRCPLARIMARDLLDTNDVDDVLMASTEFAAALQRAGLVLSWTGAPTPCERRPSRTLPRTLPQTLH